MNPRVKVVFISGYTANAIHKNFVLEEGFDYLAKPFTPATLGLKIREILDRPAAN